MDRVELAWRIELGLAGVEPPFEYGGLGPVAANAHDGTYHNRGLWNGGVERGVVIGDQMGGEDLSPPAMPGGDHSARVLEYRIPGRVLKQVRVDLGTRDLPGDEGMIQSLARTYASRWVGTYWMRAGARPGWGESWLPRGSS